MWYTHLVDCSKPGTSHIKPTRTSQGSTGGVEQDATSETHEISDFDDQKVPSCFSIEGRLYISLTRSSCLLGPFRDFLADPKYAQKKIVWRNDNYRDLIVKVLLTLGLHVVFNEFCKIDAYFLLGVCSP